jgi:hypothetical protein
MIGDVVTARTLLLNLLCRNMIRLKNNLITPPIHKGLSVQSGR